jgi:hypothetical protein
MNALEIVKTAAHRIGIVSPNTIEDIESLTIAKRDSDAMLLLEGLNQTLHLAMAAGTSDTFKREISVSPSYRTPSTWTDVSIAQMGYNLYDVIKDYGGLYTAGFLGLFYKKGEVTTQVPDRVMFREMEFNKFLTLTSAAGYNVYSIINGKIYFLTDLDLSLYDDAKTRIAFIYKSLWAVEDVENNLKYSFTKNTDVALTDTELLILGTVLNYKAYMGMDVQYDAATFQTYIAALDKNRQRENQIRDNSLAHASSSHSLY